MVREFFAFGQKLGRTKRAVPFSICPVFGLVSALRLHSCRAVPSAQVPSVYHIPYLPFRKGDISTLAKRGHFYFGLTLYGIHSNS